MSFLTRWPREPGLSIWPNKGSTPLGTELVNCANTIYRVSTFSPAGLNSHLYNELNSSICVSLFRDLSSALLTFSYSATYYGFLVDRVCPHGFCQSLLGCFGCSALVPQSFPGLSAPSSAEQDRQRPLC